MTTDWPALDSEAMEWRSAIAESGVRAARNDRATVGYRASVPPMIGGRDLRLSGELSAYAEDATEALVRLDDRLGGEIAPFAALLLRSESAASSQIEHLTASARQIFTAELGAPTRTNATMIASNTRAMRSALELADELSVKTVLAMHSALMEHDGRHRAGVFRDEPVWVGTSSRSPVGAVFVAPRHERVRSLMDDVMAFARRDDLPRLAQAAIAHAQFETIHPFTDGNGRTGRALLQSMLRGKGLTRNVTVPVSAGLLTDTDGYVDALTRYRAGEPEQIVRLVADAVFLAVDNSEQLVRDVHAIQERWRTAVVARSHSGIWRALDVLARQPVLDAATLAAQLGVEQRNAYPYLNRLAEFGVVQKKTEYRFGTLYRSDAILHALDAFAERAGRRR